MFWRQQYRNATARSSSHLSSKELTTARRISTPQKLITDGVKPLIISAKGHGTRQQCRTDKHGFPVRYCSTTKFHKGFQTGDIVKAVVTSGKKVGVYIGRVATRATGSFNISTSDGLIQGISQKFCKHIHKKDGYAYT